MMMNNSLNPVRRVKVDEDDEESKEELQMDIVLLAKMALRHGRYDTYKGLVQEAKLQGIDLNKKCKRKTGSKATRLVELKNKGTSKRLVVGEDAAKLTRSMTNLGDGTVEEKEDNEQTSFEKVLADSFQDDPLFEELQKYSTRCGPVLWPRNDEIASNWRAACVFHEPEEDETDPPISEEEQALIKERMERHRFKQSLLEMPAKEKNKQELYKMYKSLHKDTNNETVQNSLTPRSVYLKACKTSALTPEPLHLMDLKKDQKIDLSFFGIGNEHAVALSDALGRLPNLKTLILRQNRLTGQTFTHLLNNVAKSSRLKIIDLSENVLSIEGAEMLAEALKNSTTLKTLRLNGARLGENHIKILCHAMKKKTCILKSLHLSDNNIARKSGGYLGEMLLKNKSLTVLNLSWNNLTGPSADQFLEGVKYNRRLETLDLRWNMLGRNGSVDQLARALSKNKSLTHLDLSYNHLDAEQCKALSAGLNVNHTLLGLHMAGNAFKTGPSGFLVARKPAFGETILEHKRVVHEYASICNTSSKKSGNQHKHTMRQTLIQTMRPSKKIGKESSVPTTATDANINESANSPQPSRGKQMLQKSVRRIKSFRSAVIAVSTLAMAARSPVKRESVLDKPKDEEKAKSLPEPPPKPRHTLQDKKLQKMDPECKDCWICGRWREVRIEFVDYSSAEKAVVAQIEKNLQEKEEREKAKEMMGSNPYKQKFVSSKKLEDVKLPPPLEVYVHLSCDGFSRPRKLRYIKGDFKYEAFVMLPPGLCEFYFTVSDPSQRSSKKVFALAPSIHAWEASPDATRMFQRQNDRDGNNKTSQYPQVWRGRDVPPPTEGSPGSSPLRLHAMSVVARAERNLSDGLRAKPRDVGKEGARRMDWRKDDSVFAKYPDETTNFMVRAFKADIQHAKFNKFIKEPEERHEMFMVMQEYYSLLNTVYQLFCANSTGQSVTSVGWNAFTDMCQTCNIPDDNLLLKDLDNLFVLTNVTEGEVAKDSNGKNLNPDRDLCRYEFMEIIGRIAYSKFVRPGIVPTPGLAVRKLVDENLIPYLDIENPKIFRERFLWQPKTDAMYKTYLKVLDKIFRRCADTNMNRKNKRISVRGFRAFLGAAGVFNPGGCCTERDARLSYRLSMISVIDEMATENHLSISFVEFLEAFGRVAYLCDLSALEKHVASFEVDFEPRAKTTDTSKTIVEEETGEEENSSEDESSDDEDDDDDDENNVAQVKVGFPKKLALLLRLMIWHPAIYDRDGKKSKIRTEKSHEVLLRQRPSVAVPPSLSLKY